MSSTARVSVVVPCYNRADIVGRAIQSVLTQTCRDLELILVDDASTDGTAKVLEESAAADPRVRVLLNQENRGPGGARNRGIDAAQGEWIALLDSDDWYEPRRLERLLDEAERDGAKLVADNQFFVRPNGNRPFYHLRPKSSGPPRRLTPEDLLKGDRWGRMTNLGLLKPLVKRQFLRNFGIQYDEEFSLGEDFYFLLRCCERASYALFVPEPLYNYQMSEGTLGSSPSLQTVTSILRMHERCRQQFGSRAEPSVIELMDKRAIDLENAIRYKLLAAPMKSLDVGTVMTQVLRDPGVLPIAGRMVALHLGRRLAYLRGRI